MPLTTTDRLLGLALEVALLPVTVTAWVCCSVALEIAGRMMNDMDEETT